MSRIRPIRTEEDYEAALSRIDDLMDSEPDSPEGEELEVLVDLVELYESRHVPMGYPSPVAALEFRMEQGGLTAQDLVPFIGSRAKVSEVLRGKRPITMPMARALHEHLGIPADVLLRDPGMEIGAPLAGLEWTRFPLRAMAKAGWIPSASKTKQRAEKLMRGLIERAGGDGAAAAALYRRNDQTRANAKMDSYALRAWCWQAMAVANEGDVADAYKTGTVTPDYLRQVAQLSWSEDGPRLAKEFLAGSGIPLVILPHLPKTYLDGAALRLGDGRPLVALTLRYDRIDNFWFSLLHELAHIGCHMDQDGDNAFVDDFSLRKLEGGRVDAEEAQADEWAEEALIPRAVWESSEVRQQASPMAVLNLARALQVHPAIVAGRVRFERNNYRLLSQFVGTGEVRRLFGLAA